MNHGDIKPANVFITGVGQVGKFPRIVIGDFGSAVNERDFIRSGGTDEDYLGGTLEYSPPEGLISEMGLLNTRFGPESDIWGVGITAHMLSRVSHALDREMLKSDRPMESTYSDTLNKIVGNLTCGFSERLTAQQLVRQVTGCYTVEGGLRVIV